MYNRLYVISFAAGLDAAARETERGRLDRAVAALPGALSRLSAPTLPHVYNGGDHLLRVAFADARAARDVLAGAAWRRVAAMLADPSRVARAEQVGYGGGAAGGGSPRPGVYRAALFAATRAPSPERLAAFAAETVALPRYIHAIRSWRLAPVEDRDGSGGWTHVWEQEYRDLDGLQDAYMRHPAHWARVERWFDLEFPEHLVDPCLVHTFCAIDGPVLRPDALR